MAQPVHNKNSQAKVPALVHFVRLGYEFLPPSNCVGKYDSDINQHIEQQLWLKRKY